MKVSKQVLAEIVKEASYMKNSHRDYVRKGDDEMSDYFWTKYCGAVDILHRLGYMEWDDLDFIPEAEWYERFEAMKKEKGWDD